MAGKLEIRAFFDEPTNTVSYLIWDRDSREAAVVDPVLDWNNRNGTVDTRSADAILAAAGEAGLAAPLLLLPSIQVNIRAGQFPEAESNGVRYLKIPVRGKMAA